MFTAVTLAFVFFFMVLLISVGILGKRFGDKQVILFLQAVKKFAITVFNYSKMRKLTRSES